MARLPARECFRSSSLLGRRRQRITTAKLTFRRDPDFQDRKSLPTLRRSQLLRDLLITSGGVAGSNSRLWRSQARDFRGPKRFLHLFSCAIASIFIVPTSNFSRVTTKTSPSFALSIICSASAIVWSSKQ